MLFVILLPFLMVQVFHGPNISSRALSINHPSPSTPSLLNSSSPSTTSPSKSTVYFHQYNQPEASNILMDSGKNKTELQNLTSSETQSYYNYDPWSSLDHLEDGGYGYGGESGGRQHPPIPMDIINDNSADAEDRSDDDPDYDDYNDEDDDNDQEHSRQRRHQDNDQDDDYATEQGDDSGVGGNGESGSDFDIPWNSDGDDGEFDQENSASFNIPKVEIMKGCKTVYKEIKSSTPSSDSSIDGFDSDLEMFRRRRRKRSTTDDWTSDSTIKNGTNNRKRGSYIMTRECHFTNNDDNETKDANKLNKPKGTKTDESRFVPLVNADFQVPSLKISGPRVASRFHSFPPAYSHHHIYFNNHKNNRKSSFLNDDDDDGVEVAGPNFSPLFGQFSPPLSRHPRPYLHHHHRHLASRNGLNNPFRMPLTNNMYHYHRHQTSSALPSNSNSDNNNNGDDNDSVPKTYSTTFNYFHKTRNHDMKPDNRILLNYNTNENNNPNINNNNNNVLDRLFQSAHHQQQGVIPNHGDNPGGVGDGGNYGTDDDGDDGVSSIDNVHRPTMLRGSFPETFLTRSQQSRPHHQESPLELQAVINNQKRQMLLANDEFDSDGDDGDGETNDDDDGDSGGNNDDYSVRYGGGNFDSYENSYDSNNDKDGAGGGGSGNSSGEHEMDDGNDYEGEGDDGHSSSSDY